MKIAVIGGGISGLTAAWRLRKHHDVTLFEAAPRLGGHTWTTEVEEEGRKLAVDMGFIVFNDRTYPHFISLLEELGVKSRESTMSFSVRCERTGLEYNGSSMAQIFAQKRNLLRPSFYRMLLDILRFHRVAPELLERPTDDSETIAEWTASHGFSEAFRQHYLVPVSASIWSTDPRRVGEFPARVMAAFLDNHGMLQVEGRPQWYTVEGGSQRYVEKIAAGLGERIVLGSPIASIRRGDDGVEVKPQDGEAARFDYAILAVHSDQALRLLADPSDAEREVLGSIPYQANEVTLHTDVSLLPRRRKAWASWNYHLHPRGREEGGPVRMSYYMNELQRLDAKKHYLVTLNRADEIAPEHVIEQHTMHHPLFTQEGCAAQRRWTEIDGVRRTSYCGAWWGWGFHEDGVRSGLRVAAKLAPGASFSRNVLPNSENGPVWEMAT